MQGGAGSGGSSEERPPAPTSPAVRYAYLVARLRNRQITMEEATELFGILQDSLARANARSPAAVASPTPAQPAPPREPAPPGLPITDETIALSLMAAGAGAGLLSAILKRSAEGPRSPPAK
jgi:hypothetical protein